MKLKFIESCTIFPDGKETDVIAGAELEVSDDEYAVLLIDKGHAVEAGKAPASKKEKA